jgi:hypothetical protein
MIRAMACGGIGEAPDHCARAGAAPSSGAAATDAIKSRRAVRPTL